ncbi:TIGR04554 family membrane protein [Mycoplasma mycoides]|uniref:TIGR04554 family membrane protein n=1 Tax=Mycoplasma mycoides TaxID=2102 RepID=UPI00224067CC|nr:TIGR04554 family membrane protein [Mycoplasma mycoides]
MILAKAPSSSEQEAFGLSKDIIPVSVIGLIITLAAIAFLSWLVYKNKEKLFQTKRT